MSYIDELHSRLQGRFVVDYHPEVTSTNDRALALAREGAPGGTVVVADVQTAGRGRRGACWHAPAGSSVLCSLLVRPATTIPPAHLAILTGVGVAQGLARLGAAAKIKWPNDIMLADRKVAGILVETTGDAVVIGVGVNCTVPAEIFPAEVRARAGSLHTLLAREIHRAEVLDGVLTGLTDALARVEAGQILKVLIDWNRLNWLTRRRVRVSGPFGVVEGDGLFLDGRQFVLHIFTDAGTVTMPLSSTVEAR